MYFAALLARTEDGWEASDTELDSVETLSDLTDLARAASAGEDTVIAYIEQEDAWFGIVRVDGEEDPRLYLSDAAAAARSAYGEILLTDELLGRTPEDEDELDTLDLDGTEEGEELSFDLEEDVYVPDADQDPVGSAGPLGDGSLLSDLGMTARQLSALGPGEALSEIAEALGAADVLEAVR